MKKKVTVIALIVALLAVLSLGTAAYFTAEDTATNVITSGSVDIKLHEMAIKEPCAEPVPFENGQGVMPGSVVSKIVTVENTGSGTAWVRISIEKAITLAEGLEGEIDLDLIRLDLDTEHWTEHDGYYYYNAPLAAGETTEPLFTTVTFAHSMGNLYQGSEATVSVFAQATQTANNGATALEALGWPETTDEGGANA